MDTIRENVEIIKGIEKQMNRIIMRKIETINEAKRKGEKMIKSEKDQSEREGGRRR